MNSWTSRWPWRRPIGDHLFVDLFIRPLASTKGTRFHLPFDPIHVTNGREDFDD